MKKTLTLVVAAVVVAVVAAGAGTWLLLGRDQEVSQRGSCGGATYELTADRDDDGGQDGVEVGLEILSAAPGESWDVALLQGDDVLVEGQRSTDEDAELDVDAFVTGNQDDLDLRATMTPPDGDECTARVTL